MREHGLTEDEVARAKRQLRARLVFENDSVTNVAHQLGYFETVTGPRLSRRSCRRVSRPSRRRRSPTSPRGGLTRERRTVGWFRPLEHKP